MSQALSPKSPRKGKHINLRVIFLDDLVHAFQCPVKSVGQVLWDAVIQHLSLLESDYFDLMFNDETGQTCWIDRDKQITKQLPTLDTPLTFCVKFYTPDPGLLEDELTRYLFALQIKRDLATGLMPCSENTAALLASYIAQAEIGDFLVDEYTDHTYLSTMKFVLHQTTQLEQKIMEYHRQHIGESPSEADSNLLDTARKVEMYGIRLHPAKDHEQVSLSLAVAHMGVLVFQNFTKINTFSWAKIRKLSFKRKKFLIKLHPDSYVSTKGFYKDTVEFFLETRNDCKAFWKKCIEHHAFFRCQVVRKVPRNKTRVVSRGSSFRYSGRTQKQLVEYVRETIVKRPQFERSTSGRISSRSASVTPKINAKTAIHNSSDIHNSTASSGSHILDPLTDNHVSPTRVEMAEVHSDSSMSGSRSLGSPKLEHGLVISDSMESANHKTDEEMRFEDASNLKRESEDKGAESDKLKQNISNNVDMHTESANQNANDNDDDLSEDSYHLDDGGEEIRAIKLRDVGGSKNVTFSDVDGVCIDLKSGKSVKDIIEGKIAEGSCDEGSDNEVIRSSKIDEGKIEPSECITASVKGLDQRVTKDNVIKVKMAQVLDQNANTPLTDVKLDTDNRKLSDDLIEDIPYYLHRRMMEGEQDRKTEISVFTVVDTKVSQLHEGSPSIQGIKDKHKLRSLSPGGKPKIGTINVKQLKYTDHSPSPPSRRSRVLERTSPLDRSPSSHRRLELVNTSKLPPRDSYSSVDDTTSPSFEKEILKQIEVQSLKHVHVNDIDNKSLSSDKVSSDIFPKESGKTITAIEEKGTSVENVLNAENKTPDIDKAIETAEHELKNLKTDNNLTAAASSKTERKVMFNIWGQGNSDESGIDKLSQKTKASIISDIVEQNLTDFGVNPEHVAVNRPTIPKVVVENSDLFSQDQNRTMESKPVENVPAVTLEEESKTPKNISVAVSEKGPKDLESPSEKTNVHEVAAPLPERDLGSSVDPPIFTSSKPPPVGKKPPPVLTKPKKSPQQLKDTTQPQGAFHPTRSDENVQEDSFPKREHADSKDPAQSKKIATLINSVPNQAEIESTKESVSASQIKDKNIKKAPIPTPGSKGPVIVDHTVIAVKPKVIPKDAKIPVKEKKKEPKKDPKDERPKSVMTTFGVQVESPQPEEHQSYVVESGDKNAWYSVKPDPKQTNVFMEEIPSPKNTSNGDKNIFDLPSPAAAFVYSDDDSPPSKEEPSPTEPTFSTFRPDPPEDSSPVEQQPSPAPLRSIRSDRDPKQRWSLQKVEEEDESASSNKRQSDAAKRVSFHGDMRDSYMSDVSLLVLRSPMDDNSSLGGSHHEDYLQTLENLRNQDSESDMMFSGSSGTDSDTDNEILDNINTAKEIYMQYAANKCLAESGRDMTVDSGVGELENRDLSPLDSLEKLKNMEGSFMSEGKIEEEEDFPPPPPFLENPSDSSSDTEVIPSMKKRMSVDPLANLEYTDIPEYTTSESESDFEDKYDVSKQMSNVRLSTYSSPEDPVQSPDDIEELLEAAEKVTY
ncbi:hypothetical protein SNE40_021317 [Patella caerulea]|uniref:FERM domain-containing protein n=1 Tax=Patella caerulea TaxID=87958 RepID=A0AAN8G440_PATCE